MSTSRRPVEISAAKAAEIASALERAAREIAKVADMLPKGFGDNRTPNFSVEIGCLSADTKRWSKVMWDVTAQKKHQERAA